MLRHVSAISSTCSRSRFTLCISMEEGRSIMGISTGIMLLQLTLHHHLIYWLDPSFLDILAQLNSYWSRRMGLNGPQLPLPHPGPRDIRSTVPGRIPLLFSNSRSLARDVLLHPTVSGTLQMGPTALRDIRTTEQLE